MSERPTPETDAEHQQFAMGGFTLDFCRKLERERDEARADAKALAERLTALELSSTSELARLERECGEDDPTHSEIWGKPAEGGIILPKELVQAIVEPWKTIAAKLALSLIGSSREFSLKALDEYQTMLNDEIFQKKEEA